MVLTALFDSEIGERLPVFSDKNHWRFWPSFGMFNAGDCCAFTSPRRCVFAPNVALDAIEFGSIGDATERSFYVSRPKYSLHCG